MSLDFFWKSHLSNPFVVDSKRSLVSLTLYALSFLSLYDDDDDDVNEEEEEEEEEEEQQPAPRFFLFWRSRFACGDERPRRLTKTFQRSLSLSLE